MKQIWMTAIILIALAGCATGPSSSVRDKIWYAEAERPATAPWHVYLMFTDDSHFIYWRTVKNPDLVLKNIDYYTTGPGQEVGNPVLFTRTGNRISAVSQTPFKSKTGETLYTDIRTFNGHLIDGAWEMDFERITTWPPRPSFSEGVIRWSMKRLSTLPVK